MAKPRKPARRTTRKPARKQVRKPRRVEVKVTPEQLEQASREFALQSGGAVEIPLSSEAYLKVQRS